MDENRLGEINFAIEALWKIVDIFDISLIGREHDGKIYIKVIDNKNGEEYFLKKIHKKEME